MSIQIGNYRFEGPYLQISNLEGKSGVYVILTGIADKRYRVIDIGESADIWTRITCHDRKSCWERNVFPGSFITFAVLYCNENDRVQIEKALRNAYEPTCGEI
ncbi:hypothetical protein CVU76_00475 [Candidatus Dojkabacteria bacterium HGW-Dojkabacteria-1]|uniref:GIY-YIG domain-containing protein n=1 Tax=Candidatus Dojkabacteria bacterium HGW-Dojkabacteria-1 TaxID=2013761 RepID=A0A2N2F2P5_9BACT|nr:MAG: hypothetical protein CVU76_00475 [Candidatus Dojkabacteria bacterium HGW-Dojkabacteria-1]